MIVLVKQLIQFVADHVSHLFELAQSKSIATQLHLRWMEKNMAITKSIKWQQVYPWNLTLGEIVFPKKGYKDDYHEVSNCFWYLSCSLFPQAPDELVAGQTGGLSCTAEPLANFESDVPRPVYGSPEAVSGARLHDGPLK